MSNFYTQNQSNNNFVNWFATNLIAIVALVFLSGWPAAATAQILNADVFGKRAQKEKGIAGGFQVGFDLAKEKETIVTISNSSDFSLKLGNNLLILANEFEFLRSGGENLLNGGFVHFRTRHRTASRLNPETFLQFQWIGVRGLDDRALAGSNLRYRVHGDSLGTVHVALGGMFEFERWSFSAVDPSSRPPDISPVDFERFKVNAYVSVSRKLGQSFSGHFVTYYQSKPDGDFFRPRISASAKLLFRLSDVFGISINYSSFYDSKPPVPIDKFFFRIDNALEFAF